MEQQLPKTFKALYLEAPGKELVVKEVDMPTLNEGQVIVKVEAAPINPADMMFMLGLYASPKKYPCVPGMEGAGTVVAGKGAQAEALVGKRVGFSATTDFTGSYGSYCVTNTMQALPVPTDVTAEVAASSFVNPFTVAAMLETVKSKNVKTVVHTAAASQLGRMMVRYFQNNGVNVINVVRKQEQVDILKGVGAKHILNQTDKDFNDQLVKLSADLEATIAFDAVAGELTGTIINAMPNNSTIYVYGGLSAAPIGNVGIGDLIFRNKAVEGFWLSSKFFTLPKEKQGELVQTIAKSLNTDFKTDIQKSFNYEQANEAIKFYQANMSGGKICLKP